MTPDKSRGKRLASPPETAAIAVSLAKAGWPVFPVTIYVGDDGKRHKVPAVPKGTSSKLAAVADAIVEFDPSDPAVMHERIQTAFREVMDARS